MRRHYLSACHAQRGAVLGALRRCHSTVIEIAGRSISLRCLYAGVTLVPEMYTRVFIGTQSRARACFPTPTKRLASTCTFQERDRRHEKSSSSIDSSPTHTSVGEASFHVMSHACTLAPNNLSCSPGAKVEEKPAIARACYI